MPKLSALALAVSAAAVVALTSAAVPASATPLATPSASGMSPNSSVITPSVISANEKTAFDFFVAKGLTKKQAAGIVGNFDQESGMDPTIKQYGGGPGRGIAQWSVGGRWDTTSGDNEVHYTNVVLGVSRYDLEGQLKFTWHELTDIGYGYSSLKATTTVNSATTVFESKFEICGDCNTAARESFANAAYNKYS